MDGFSTIPQTGWPVLAVLFGQGIAHTACVNSPETDLMAKGAAPQIVWGFEDIWLVCKQCAGCQNRHWHTAVGSFDK